MASKNQRQGISWELIGIVAILAVLVVGGVLILADGFSHPDQSKVEVETPTIFARDPALGLDAADMQGIDADGRPFLGKAAAPVVLYEFADFQCPHCRDFSLFQNKELKKDLVTSGKARLTWVAFPFMDDSSGEEESVNAQMAAHCAGKQGKFWEMHDWLFTNQDTVSNRGRFNTLPLHDLAVKAGLDGAVYDTCMADPATAAFIKAEKEFGAAKGVDSTPSFLIKGQDKVFAGGDATTLNNVRDAVLKAAASGG